MIYERIKKLCNENDISVNELEQKIGIAKGSLCKIDKHKPGLDKLQKLAIELNTTEKYILKGEEPEFSIEMAEKDIALTNMETKLKDYALKLSQMPKEKQEHIMNLIDMLEGKKG
jgi:transcriptional regulator with XRE-family HTH domain